MNRLQLEDALCNTRRYLKEIERIVPSCQNCTHLNPANQSCAANGDQVVPEDFRKVGCTEGWEYDEIPF